MATYVSQYSTTGFYRAPVSKGLMGALFATCTAINVPLFSHLRQYLVCQLPNIFTSKEIWRLITAQAAFLDTKDLICGAFLIYYFRIFERRFGSKKFASYLLSTGVLSLVIEVAIVSFIRTSRWEVFHHGFLPPGPYGLIFPLFVPYLCDIPRVTQTHFLGVPISGKTLTYLVGLQVCSTSIPTAISAFSSIVAGILYRTNFINLQKWFVVPDCIAKAADMTLGRLLESSPPAFNGPMGATLEIQRQEQMERLEQQVLLQRTRDGNRLNAGQGYAERLVGPDAHWGEPNGLGRRRRPQDLFNANAAQPLIQEPTEENVTFLISMGFPRERVIRALRSTGNNVEAATNLLLQQP